MNNIQSLSQSARTDRMPATACHLPCAIADIEEENFVVLPDPSRALIIKAITSRMDRLILSSKVKTQDELDACDR